MDDISTVQCLVFLSYHKLISYSVASPDMKKKNLINLLVGQANNMQSLLLFCSTWNMKKIMHDVMQVKNNSIKDSHDIK